MSEDAQAADGETGSTDDLDYGHLSSVVLGAVVLALYAAWMGADLVPRWLLFPVVALLTGYILSQRESGHDKSIFVGYALAGMIFLTPLLFFVPDVTSGYNASTSELLFTSSNFFLFVLFVIPAVVVAYVTYRADGGRGVFQRLRGLTSG